MAASTGDKITDVRNAARPNSARATGTRAVGGLSLACDNLTGWPTASKVHFVTYQLDSSSEPVAGTQIDCYGIVSGNTIGSISVIDGTDIGNSVNDVVEMLPTAAWGQDLADALTTEHSRTGTHTAITATSLTATGNVQSGTALISDTVSEKTAATGVTVDGLLIKDGNVRAFDKSVLTTDSNPYKFYAYPTSTVTSPGIITASAELFDTNNNYNTSTYLYTVPVTGYYYLEAMISYNLASITGYAVVIKKNTSTTLASNTSVTQGSSSTYGINVSYFGPLTAADTVGFYSAGTAGANVFGDATLTFLHGYLVSRT